MVIIVPRTFRTEMTWRCIGGQDCQLQSSVVKASSDGLVSVYCCPLPSYDSTDPIEVFVKRGYGVLACLIGFWSPAILE